MKFVAYNNQPNVSGSRFKAIAPSMALDSRSYPHISWFTQKNGYNEVNYKYWDGLEWKYYNTPALAKSKKEVVYSPNGLTLGLYDNPYIVYSRNDEEVSTNDILAVAMGFNGQFLISEAFLDYDVAWAGIQYIPRVFESYGSSSSSDSSSSSSSVNEKEIICIIVYGSDEKLRIYTLNGASLQLVSVIDVVADTASLRVTSCGRKMGVSYLQNNQQIKYNFFDFISSTWNYESFQTLAASITAYQITDMDMVGYCGNVFSLMFATIIDSSSGITTKYFSVDGNGNEISQTLEDISNPMTLPTGYDFGGYVSIGICSDYFGNPVVMASGITTALFVYDGTWVKNLVDMNAGCGNSPYNIRMFYSGSSVKSVFCNHGDTIYYFEQDLNSAGFDIIYPQLVLLNKQRLYSFQWQDVSIGSGSEIVCAYGSRFGDLARNSLNPTGIFFSEEDPCCGSSSSSSSGDQCPNDIRAIDGSIVVSSNAVDFTFDRYINVSVNENSNNGYYLLTYYGNTAGQTPSHKVFYGQTTSGEGIDLVGDGYVSVFSGEDVFYTPKYTSLPGGACCSNIVGDDAKDSDSVIYNLYGYGLINANNSSLRYIPLYAAGSLEKRWVATWEFSCISDTWALVSCEEEQFSGADPHSDNSWEKVSNCSYIHYGQSYPSLSFPATCDISTISPYYPSVIDDCCRKRWVQTFGYDCNSNSWGEISCNEEICNLDDSHADDTWEQSTTLPCNMIYYGIKYLFADFPAYCEGGDIFSQTIFNRGLCCQKRWTAIWTWRCSTEEWYLLQSYSGYVTWPDNLDNTWAAAPDGCRFIHYGPKYPDTSFPETCDICAETPEGQGFDVAACCDTDCPPLLVTYTADGTDTYNLILYWVRGKYDPWGVVDYDSLYQGPWPTVIYGPTSGGNPNMLCIEGFSWEVCCGPVTRNINGCVLAGSCSISPSGGSPSFEVSWAPL